MEDKALLHFNPSSCFVGEMLSRVQMKTVEMLWWSFKIIDAKFGILFVSLFLATKERLC